MNARFFAYTTDSKDLCKNFEENWAKLTVLMSSLICGKAIQTIKNHCFEAGLNAEKEMAKLEDIIANLDNNVRKLSALLDNEPARKADVMRKRNLLPGQIKAHRARSLADFERKYGYILCEGHIVSIIERKGLKSKKEIWNCSALISVLN